MQKKKNSHIQPYRSRNIGSRTLQHILDAAKVHKKPKISDVYLHVQVSNADAKRFYERHDFKEIGIAQVSQKRSTVLRRQYQISCSPIGIHYSYAVRNIIRRLNRVMLGYLSTRSLSPRVMRQSSKTYRRRQRRSNLIFLMYT